MKSPENIMENLIQISRILRVFLLEIGGQKFKKNDAIILAIFSIHRDERYFPEPDKFNPDRFLNENPTDKHPFCYIPFSAGRRNCIGQKFAQMELKIVIANLLRNFKINSDAKLDDVVQAAELTLHPVYDVCADFFSR